MSRTPSFQTKDWQVKFLTSPIDSPINLGFVEKKQSYQLSQQARRIGHRLGLEIFTSYDQRDGSLTAQKLKGATISRELCTQAVILHLQAKARLSRKEQKLAADREVEALYTAKVTPPSSSPIAKLVHEFLANGTITIDTRPWSEAEKAEWRSLTRAHGASALDGTLVSQLNPDGTLTYKHMKGD